MVAAPDYDERSASTATSSGSGEEEQLRRSAGGAKVMILDAGRATLELSNPAQIDYIDRSRSAGPGSAGSTGWPSRWTTAAAVTERLAAAGAELIAPPTRTPWNSLNARLTGPAELQLTVFTELNRPGRD